MTVVLKPKLTNCEKMHRRYPTTFEIPDEQDLDSLQVGDFVKVIVPGERFWVIIRERTGDNWIGQIDNDIEQEQLKYGDLIQFTRHNICDFTRND